MATYLHINRLGASVVSRRATTPQSNKMALYNTHLHTPPSPDTPSAMQARRAPFGSHVRSGEREETARRWVGNGGDGVVKVIFTIFTIITTSKSTSKGKKNPPITRHSTVYHRDAATAPPSPPSSSPMLTKAGGRGGEHLTRQTGAAIDLIGVCLGGVPRSPSLPAPVNPSIYSRYSLPQPRLPGPIFPSTCPNIPPGTVCLICLVYMSRHPPVQPPSRYLALPACCVVYHHPPATCLSLCNQSFQPRHSTVPCLSPTSLHPATWPITCSSPNNRP